MATRVTSAEFEQQASGGLGRLAIGITAVTVAAVALSVVLLSGSVGGSRQSKTAAVSAPASVQAGTSRQPTHGALAEDYPNTPAAELRPATHGALADDGVVGPTPISTTVQLRDLALAPSAHEASVTHGQLP